MIYQGYKYSPRFDHFLLPISRLIPAINTSKIDGNVCIISKNCVSKKSHNISVNARFLISVLYHFTMFDILLWNMLRSLPPNLKDYNEYSSLNFFVFIETILPYACG